MPVRTTTPVAEVEPSTSGVRRPSRSSQKPARFDDEWTPHPLAKRPKKGLPVDPHVQTEVGTELDTEVDTVLDLEVGTALDSEVDSNAVKEPPLMCVRDVCK